MRYALIAGAVLSLAGCQERVEASKMLGEEEGERVVVLVYDMSLSFDEKMVRDGKAYKFSLEVIDHYFRSSIGSNDRIVIAQISANKDVLLWDGTPARLRQEFSTPESFNDFLKSKSVNNASPIAEGITHVLDYVMSDPRVESGKAKSAVLVLSDMLDNGESTWRPKALEKIAEYARKGGVMGLYYVSTKPDLVTGWRKYLKRAGMREVCVEGEKVDKPRLPSLE